MEEQALVNLLGIKGGAKRAFAESTLALMASMTPQQYHQYMIAEIQRVLPALKQTVAGFGLSNPSEIDAYDAMIKRLEIGLGVDWSKFHAVHSAVKIAVPKAPKAAPVPGYANGVVSVPGPKGKGDVVPAMLSPGEAVIPAGMAKKYAPLISSMVAGNIPGYSESVPGGVPVPLPQTSGSNFVKLTQSRISRFFGEKGEMPINSSHFQSVTVEKYLSTLGNALSLLGDEAEDSKVKVIEYTRAQDENGKSILKASVSYMDLSKAVEKFGGGDYSAVTGGYSFGPSAKPESAARNIGAYENILPRYMTREEASAVGTLGSPETLEDVMFHGDLAARALKDTSRKLTELERQVLNNLIEEGNRAKESYTSLSSEQDQLAYVIGARRKGFENKLMADTGLDDVSRSEKRGEINAKLAAIEELYYKETSEGLSHQDALNKVRARLIELANKESQFANESIQTMHVGKTGEVSSNDLRGAQRRTSKVPILGADRDFVVGKTTTDVAASMVMAELGSGSKAREGALFSVVKSAMSRVLDVLFDGITDTMADFAEVSSPSKRAARKVGIPIVQGIEEGALSGVDDAGVAGQKIARAAVQEMEKVAVEGVYQVPGSRRATTNPELAAMPAGTQTGGPRAPRRATAPQQAAGGAGQTGLMAADGMMLQIGASAGRASTEIDRLGETAKKGGVGLLGYGGIVSNLTFGATALAGAMSTVGGDLGAFGQEIFKISGFIFAATSVIQAFTQAKVLELATTRAKIASD
jgi:hypothetical protein